MRWDRFLTLSLARVRGRADPDRRQLPILMYHSISDDPETGVHPYFRVCTSPRRFAEQMQWLAEAGWKGVTLSDGLRMLRQSGTDDSNPKIKPVVITFDDGFRDFYTTAYPLLQQHGFSATMYVPTALMADPRHTFKGRDCMIWAEILELQTAGVEFGSHTVNHPRLVELAWPDIERELRDSRTELEQRLQRAVAHFAYPYAYPQAETKFSDRFQGLLTEIGYETNVTTLIRRASPQSDPLRLPRLPANSDDDRAFFEAKLAGHYDWMARPQALTKTIARYVRPGRRPRA